MFTDINLRVWQLKKQMAQGNITNLFCVYNHKSNCYYLAFDYYLELFIPGELMNYSSGDHIQSFLCNSWPLFGISNPKKFDSFNQCNDFIRSLGYSGSDLPLKIQTDSILIDLDNMSIVRNFRDISPQFEEIEIKPLY